LRRSAECLSIHPAAQRLSIYQRTTSAEVCRSTCRANR
jgi:hypothetical protein